jgi:uncharacterized protein YcfL
MEQQVPKTLEEAIAWFDKNGLDGETYADYAATSIVLQAAKDHVALKSMLVRCLDHTSSPL